MDRNSSLPSNVREKFVAPRRGAWIEIIGRLLLTLESRRRTPQGCVDRNSKLHILFLFSHGRTPQGCVDRNIKTMPQPRP